MHSNVRKQHFTPNKILFAPAQKIPLTPNPPKILWLARCLQTLKSFFFTYSIEHCINVRTLPSEGADISHCVKSNLRNTFVA